MDQPHALSDKVATLFAALAFSQTVGVLQVRQHADIPMTVPMRQRFWKRRVQRLPIRSFGRIPKIADADQSVPAGRIRSLLVQQNGRLLDIKSLRFQRLNEMD